MELLNKMKALETSATPAVEPVQQVGKQALSLISKTHSVDRIKDMLHRIQMQIRNYMNTVDHCFVIILFTDMHTIIEI